MFCKKHQHAYVKVCSECVVEVQQQERRLMRLQEENKNPAPLPSHQNNDTETTK